METAAAIGGEKATSETRKITSMAGHPATGGAVRSESGAEWQ